MIKKFLLIIPLVMMSTFSFAQKEKADKLYEKGYYAKAIPLYIKASEQGGKEKKDALVKLGDCYRILNEFKKAEATYKKAVKAKGTASPDLLYNYGCLLYTSRCV